MVSYTSLLEVHWYIQIYGLISFVLMRKNLRQKIESCLLRTHFFRSETSLVLCLLGAILLLSYLWTYKEYHHDNDEAILTPPKSRAGNLKYISNLYSTHEMNDVPFLWQIPHSTHLLEEILIECYTLESQASDIMGMDTNIAVTFIKSNSPMKPQIIMSPELQLLASTFTNTTHGRFFTIFRDPDDVAIDSYHEYMSNHPNLVLALEDFLASDLLQDDWVTRSLSASPKSEDLKEDHLEVAKAILREKCLVGLFDRMEETFDRFQRFFHWDPGLNSHCTDNLLLFTAVEPIDLEQKSSRTKEILQKRNRFDKQLYQYVVDDLFDDEWSIDYNLKRQRPIKQQQFEGEGET